MHHRKSFALLSLCLGTASLPLHAGDKEVLAGESLKNQIPIETSGGKVVYRFIGGASYRKFGGISFRTNGVSARAPLFRTNQDEAFARAGSTGAIADRQYDNGYVRQDAGTASDGRTWNWGYTSASQVAGDSLNYRSDLGYTANSSADGWDAEQDAWSPFLAFEALFPLGHGLSFGPHFSVAYASISDSRNGLQTVSGQQNVLQDTFALNGVIPPAAPYSNTFAGPGPLIHNVPTSRQIVATGAVAYNQIADSLDLNLTTATVGFVADYAASRLHLSAVVGGTVNYSELEAVQNETLFTQAGAGKAATVQKYGSRTSGTDIFLGFTTQFGGSYDILDHVSLGIFGRYDWVEDLNGSVGPSSYTVDLTGWSGGVAATYFY